MHNRLDVPHALRAPGWRAPRSHANATALPLSAAVYYARQVEELRPLTYGLAHKTKLMPKDQWSTILGHSPDVADALIQSMTRLHEWRHFDPRKGRFNAGASQVGVRGFCSALF